jgi:hypothetical protein
MDFSEYRLESNGLVICEPCLTFVFFSDVQISRDESPDILAPYRAFIEAFGSEVSYCRTSGSQMHAKKITADDLAMPTKWLTDPKKRVRPQLDIELRTGSTRDEWRPPCLDFSHAKTKPPRTYYRICIPLEDYQHWGLDGVMSYLKLSLVGFPLLSGYVGYSFSWNYAKPQVEDALKPYFHQWLQRHPGLMAPDAISQARVSNTTLVDLGWITMLGKTFCDHLGGIKTLGDSLSTIPNTAIKQINGGLLIRVGDKPCLGDIKTGDDLQDYRAVGKVLSPIHDHDALLRGMVIVGVYDRSSNTIQSKWIDRFFSE